MHSVLSKFLSRRTCCLYLILILLLPSLGGCTTKTADDFAAYTDSLFQNEVAANTLTLHYTLRDPAAFGITRYTVSIGDLSPKGQKESRSALRQMQKQLKKYRHTQLDTADALTYDILCDYVDTHLALSEYNIFAEPLLPNGGDAMQLPLLMAELPLTNVQDVNDYLAMLPQLPDYFEQLLDFEKKKAKEGCFMSDTQCQSVLTALEQVIADRDNFYLTVTFENRIHDMDLPEEQKKAYIQQNKEIVATEIFPAYEKLIAGISELMGCGRNPQGLYYYDEGTSYYEALVRARTGCSQSVEEIGAWIDASRNKDFAACANLLASHPSVLEECTNYDWNYTGDQQMIDTLSAAMLTDFPQPPELNCNVCYVDPSMKEYLAPAFYITVPLDDYRDNKIYINSASDYSDIYYFTTLAHESLPGHMYQTAMSYSYGIHPLHALLDYPGYTEGWATYVEMLSYHYAGLPETVADMMMHYQAATLSLYASSDIGIHYLGWSKENLAEFWADHGVSEPQTIDRIWELVLEDPANYLSYYVGYLNFLKLRENAKERYGDAFSEKAFHEALLRIGPGPFDCIEKYLDSYYVQALK